MNISKKVLVKCEECNREFEIAGDTLDFDVVSSCERNMGEEIEFGAEGEYQCPDCDNIIFIYASYWEYPVGAYNNHEESITGGELLSNILKI